MQAARKRLKSLLQILTDIPVVGPWIKWVSIYLGIKGFAYLLIGALLVGALVFLGRWPQVLVSSTYKGTVTKPVDREKPKGRLHVEIKPGSDFVGTRWIWDHMQLLRQEGTGNFTVIVVEHELLKPNDAFEWVLTTSPGFQLSARAAYKVLSKVGSTLEPLNIKKEELDSVVIHVGASETTAVLKAIIRVSGVGQRLPDDLRKIIGSEAR